MKKIRIVLFVAFAAMAVIVMGKFLAEKRLHPGRVYKGKTVSQWVDFCVNRPTSNFSGGLTEPGMKEIHELGPEAVPFLIEQIQRKPDFTTTARYTGIYGKLPHFISKHLPTPMNTSTRPFRAYCALGDMGPQARSAVPFLASQFKADNPWLAFDRLALGWLGTNALDAVPALTNTLHSQDVYLREQAGFVLAKVCPSCPELETNLLSELKSTNVDDRRWACMAMAQIKPRSSRIIAALKEAINDTDPTVKQYATDAINTGENSQ